jgi:hypothetical protein
MRRLGMLVGLSLVVSLGCGDDAGDSGSGVEGTKRVQDLTTEDLKSFCKWQDALGDDSSLSDEQICVSDATQEAFDTADCERIVDDCIEHLDSEPVGQPGVEESYCDEVTTEDIPRGCDVTIGELESCLTELVAQANKQAAQASCDDLDGAVPSKLPESCSADMLNDCAGLL